MGGRGQAGQELAGWHKDPAGTGKTDFSLCPQASSLLVQGSPLLPPKPQKPHTPALPMPPHQHLSRKGPKATALTKTGDLEHASKTG